jgi:hypothetical protein
MSTYFLLAVFVRKHVHICQSTGSQESKIQPIGDKEINCSDCGMLILNVLSHLLSTFMMEAAISNGFGIKRLRETK